MASLYRLLMLFLIAMWSISRSYAAEVEGFLNAAFGSREDIVVDAIKKDFGESQKIQLYPVDEQTGTKTIEIKVPNFTPLDVPATISYILGYKCHCLIQVSVVWQLPQNITHAQRNSALENISKLVTSLSTKAWADGSILLGRVSDEIKEGQTSNYVFFRGVASDNSAITVWGAPVIIVKNISTAQADKGKATLTANIDKLQILGASYELNVKRPDLKRVYTQSF